MPEFNTAQTLIETGQLTEADRRRIIRDHLSSQGWSFGREGHCGLPERRKPQPPWEDGEVDATEVLPCGVCDACHAAHVLEDAVC